MNLVHGGGERLTEIERLRTQGEFARLDFGQVQQVVDQGEQMPAAGLDMVRIAGLLLGERSGHLVPQELGEAEDRVERGPQLVGHIGQEGRLVAGNLRQMVVGNLQLPRPSLDQVFQLMGVVDHLRVESGILDSGGERLHKAAQHRYVRLRVGVGHPAVQGDGPDRLSADQQRQNQRRTDPFPCDKRLIGKGLLHRQVPDQARDLLGHDPLDGGLSQPTPRLSMKTPQGRVGKREHRDQRLPLTHHDTDPIVRRDLFDHPCKDRKGGLRRKGLAEDHSHLIDPTLILLRPNQRIRLPADAQCNPGDSEHHHERQPKLCAEEAIPLPHQPHPTCQDRKKDRNDQQPTHRGGGDRIARHDAHDPVLRSSEQDADGKRDERQGRMRSNCCGRIDLMDRGPAVEIGHETH